MKHQSLVHSVWDRMLRYSFIQFFIVIFLLPGVFGGVMIPQPVNGERIASKSSPDGLLYGDGQPTTTAADKPQPPEINDPMTEGLSVNSAGTGINTANTFYAYVEAGEDLDVDFSKLGNFGEATDAQIAVRGPGGVVETCTALESGVPQVTFDAAHLTRGYTCTGWRRTGRCSPEN